MICFRQGTQADRPVSIPCETLHEIARVGQKEPVRSPSSQLHASPLFLVNGRDRGGAPVGEKLHAGASGFVGDWSLAQWHLQLTFFEVV